MVEDTEDVVVNGNRYQISRMNAAVGSWLLFKLIDSLRKLFSDNSVEQTPGTAIQETDDTHKAQAAHALVQAMLMTLDRNLFEQVQKEALKVVGQYAAVGEQEVVLPVVTANGLIPVLRNDIAGVVALTSHALYFNLSPFFLTGGLSTVLPMEPVRN